MSSNVVNCIQKKSLVKLQDSAKQYLIEQIRKGKLRSGQNIPSIRKISNTLNVSTTVTMNAVKNMYEEGWLEKSENRKHIVSKRTRKLLLSDIKTTVAFTCYGYEHIHVPAFQAIYNALSKEGRKSNITFDTVFNMNYETQSKRNDRNYDAMIVAGWKPDNYKEICKGICLGLDWFEGLEIDCSVHTDNFKGASMLAKHFYDIGRRKVAIWRGEKEQNCGKNCDLRLAGFLAGWVKAGGLADDVKIIRNVPRLQDEQLWPNLKDIEKLREYVLESIGKYDSFFIDSDMWALQVWQILEDAKVEVPEDIALAGFDGIYQAFIHKPPLTTIKNQYDLIAQEMLRVIENKIVYNKDPQEKDILIEPELVIGGSTQKFSSEAT